MSPETAAKGKKAAIAILHSCRRIAQKRINPEVGIEARAEEPSIFTLLVDWRNGLHPQELQCRLIEDLFDWLNPNFSGDGPGHVEYGIDLAEKLLEMCDPGLIRFRFAAAIRRVDSVLAEEAAASTLVDLNHSRKLRTPAGEVYVDRSNRPITKLHVNDQEFALANDELAAFMLAVINAHPRMILSHEISAMFPEYIDKERWDRERTSKKIPACVKDAFLSTTHGYQFDPNAVRLA